jgi:hypothetical protein
MAKVSTLFFDLLLFPSAVDLVTFLVVFEAAGLFSDGVFFEAIVKIFNFFY